MTFKTENITWNDVMDCCDETDSVFCYDWGGQDIHKLNWLKIEWKTGKQIKFSKPEEAMAKLTSHV